MTELIDKNKIEENYNKYKELLRSIKRDGINDLLNWLDTTDFKIAPASTVYHCDYDGGLCQHSLNVYMNLNFLVKAYKLNYSDDTLKVAALLHDISKTNFYEQSIKNQKLYSESGSKYDDIGHFDWVSVMGYKIKDPTKRMLAGDHGFNSYMITSRYIPLTDEEIIAILNHHMGMGESNPNRDMNSIADRYPLLPLLHLADMASCYFTENQNIDSYRDKNE